MTLSSSARSFGGALADASVRSSTLRPETAPVEMLSGGKQASWCASVRVPSTAASPTVTPGISWEWSKQFEARRRETWRSSRHQGFSGQRASQFMVTTEPKTTKSSI
eukprot:9722220-Heterocapsa_arctica.AAC.1